MVKRIYNHFMGDSLYRNSIYLMAGTFTMAVLGFFFWIVIARIFPTKDVGVATTLISIMTLLSNFSLLGFNVSLIRYLPKSKKRNEMINSALMLVIIASVISVFIFVGGIKAFSPHLMLLQSNIFYSISFTLFVVGASLSTIIDSIFVAYRASANVLLKNTLLSILKLALPLSFIFLGAYGIFTSVAAATTISALFGIILLLKKYSYKPHFILNKTIVKEMAIFSGGNYISGFLSLAPTLILPIIIINKLSAETEAYYYIASMILGSLTIIATATTQSLLAEGSHDNPELKNHVVKSLRITYLFLTPAVLAIILFGNIILRAFGKNYSDEAFMFLRIISISSLFISMSTLGSSIMKINHQIKMLIFTNAFGSITILGLCYLLLHRGLIGIGYGWLLGQILLAAVNACIVGKNLYSKGVSNTIKGLHIA